MSDAVNLIPEKKNVDSENPDGGGGEHSLKDACGLHKCSALRG